MNDIATLIAISKRFLKTAKQDGWPTADLDRAIRGAEAELSKLTKPADPCDHNSTITLHTFADERLSLELCTWGCGALLWYRSGNGNIIRQIGAHEAAWIFAEARKVTK